MKPYIETSWNVEKTVWTAEVRVPAKWLVITKKPRLFWWFIQLAFMSLNPKKDITRL